MKSVTSIIVAVILTVLSARLDAQSRLSSPSDVVWHWFENHQGAGALHLQVSFKGAAIYDTTFVIYQVRRGDIKPERPQRIPRFFFNAPFRIFGREFKGQGSGRIEGNIWEAGCDAHDILLGVSFVNARSILLNTIHIP